MSLCTLQLLAKVCLGKPFVVAVTSLHSVLASHQTKMLLSSLLPALLLSLSLCKGTSAIETPPLEQGAELPGGDKTCPDTWFVPRGANGDCDCGYSFDGVVSCDEETKEVRVLDCYCITFDSTSNKTVVGECFVNCVNVSKSYYDYMYHRVPRDLVGGDDNYSVCGYLHRKGTLCGQCMHNYYRAAYSYTFHCTYCEESQWLLYIVVAYVPLTFFIIFILVFRVSVVSPKLYGTISMLQTLASPLNIRVLQEAATHVGSVYLLAEVFLAAMSIWNLDFFRNVMPDNVCLRINSLQLLALDYLIAVYPMIVTVVAFFILQLHYHGFDPVLLICRPFQRMFARFRQGWNLHTSLIDAFITFYVLSTTKILHVSISILSSVQLRDAKGNNRGYYWYEDASIKFFSSIHKPYAILAISMLLLLIILPIALLVGYQFSCCKICLTKTRIKGRVLEEFMHTFNKYYKNGSGGTRDCRWFAAFYIMMRLCIYLLLFLPMSSLFYNFALVYSLLCALFVLVVEPYRDEYKRHNYLEPCVVLSLTLILTAITGVNTSNVESRKYVKPLLMSTSLVALLPIVYLCGVTVWWIYKRTPFGYRPVQQSTNSDQPDRLINSGNYRDSSTSINTVSD